MAATLKTRVAWGMLDQIVASLSNFVVVIIVARSLSPTGFGGFALAMEVYFVAVVAGRGVASDPLAAAHASDGDDDYARAVRQSTGVVLRSTVVMALLTAAVATAVRGELGLDLLALAVCLPGLALQDALRYALIVRGRARSAFFNDLFWMVIQVPLLVGALAWGDGAAPLVLAWGLAGNLTAALGLIQARTFWGTGRDAMAWLRRHRSIWPFFLMENLVFQVSNLVFVVVISFAVGLADVAAFRAALTVFAPMAILGRGVVGVALPELSRRQDRPAVVRRLAVAIGVLMVPAPLLMVVVIRLMPEGFGRAMLGESWPLAEPLLPLAGIVMAGSLFIAGLAVGLRALRSGRSGLAARIITTALGMGAAAGGGVWDGASGLFLVLACSTPLQIAVWWWLLKRAAERSETQTLTISG